MSRRRMMYKALYNTPVLSLMRFDSSLVDLTGNAIKVSGVREEYIGYSTSAKFGHSIYATGLNENYTIVNYTFPYNLSNTPNMTIECWVKNPQGANSNASVRIGCVGSEDAISQINLIVANGVYIGYTLGNTNLSGWTGYGPMASVTNQSYTSWHHMAYTIENRETLKIFLDGVLKYTASISISPNPGAYFTLVLDSSVEIDELRVSGIIRYNANFTPPTVPFK